MIISILASILGLIAIASFVFLARPVMVMTAITIFMINFLDNLTSLNHTLVFVVSMILFFGFLYIRGTIAIKNNWKTLRK